MHTQSEKSIVVEAMNNLHNEVCAIFDWGEFTPNYAEGTPLRMNLHPDGRVSREDALAPSAAPVGSLSVEFALQRRFPDEAAEGYPETTTPTEEANQWKR